MKNVMKMFMALRKNINKKRSCTQWAMQKKKQTKFKMHLFCSFAILHSWRTNINFSFLNKANLQLLIENYVHISIWTIDTLLLAINSGHVNLPQDVFQLVVRIVFFCYSLLPAHNTKGNTPVMPGKQTIRKKRIHSPSTAPLLQTTAKVKP